MAPTVGTILLTLLLLLRKTQSASVNYNSRWYKSGFFYIYKTKIHTIDIMQLKLIISSKTLI